MSARAIGRRPAATRATAAAPPAVRIGISGWTYGPWRGVFYPKALPHRRELEYAGHAFNSIEINGSFYSLQRPSSYQAWHAATPDDFVFAVKGGRFITHMKKLRDVHAPLANFFASGVLALGHKLGPILWQFPPNFGFDEERFAQFFQMLPIDTHAAGKLAAQHDDKLKGRAWIEPAAAGNRRRPAARPIRYAVEVRHDSFLNPRFVALLRRHGIAWCLADSAGRWPYAEDLTADFVYIRLHGAEQLYVSGYDEAMLNWWADRIRPWSAGREPPDARHCSPDPAPPARQRDVYVYFDNDAKVKAPFDALALAAKVPAHPPRHAAAPPGAAPEVPWEPAPLPPQRWGRRSRR